MSCARRPFTGAGGNGSHILGDPSDQSPAHCAAALVESASWHTPGRCSIAGDYEGRESIFGQFGRYGGETGGTFQAELRHVYEDDDGREHFFDLYAWDEFWS